MRNSLFITPATTTRERSTPPPFVDAGEGRLMMVLKIYELGRLSLAQEAELADHTKRAFFDALGNYGIPVVDYPVDELASETAW